jgi:hypothetical protein
MISPCSTPSIAAWGSSTKLLRVSESAKRLLDEIEGPGLHRRNRQRNSAMAGDEYHWYPPTANIEDLLQVDPAHLRHLDV